MLSKTSWEHLWYCGSTFQYFTQSESRQHWNDLESHWHDWLWCICILIYCFFVVLFYQHIKQCFVKLNFKMSVLIYHCSKAVLSLKLTWSFNMPFHVKATGKTCTLQVMIISHFPWGQLWDTLHASTAADMNSLGSRMVLKRKEATSLMQTFPKDIPYTQLKFLFSRNEKFWWDACKCWCQPWSCKSHNMIYYLVLSIGCSKGEKPIFPPPTPVQEVVLSGFAVSAINELELQY